ncbi:serine hydrolase domain-containing protein [Streptomyces sp. CB03238]|uniref:serine hydrolase domain-containing protein n=1 Tax=Streptomyces sp. CB03238 TaxID=1907777 RepID=UPI000A112A01|nr:serine hydrolase domain-containing protein [Streptomyces sp. CB03238]ORT56195.1 peptidase S12 [Streptomyces sp. CB03238]
MRAAPARPFRTRRRLTAALVAAGACAAGLIAGPAQAEGQRPDSRDRELHKALEELVGPPDGPPGAIALLQRGRDVKVYRAGVADADSGRPPRPGDHMRVASIAKAYSGAVALRLVDRGKLRLDDTIGKRLPHLPKAWHKVTLRHLLQHTSGLPDFTEDPDFQEAVAADPRREVDPHTLLDFVADKPLLFKPGSRYRYDNSDNIAVALMAEAATGRPYEELLRQLVHRPLGLRNTSLPRWHLLPRPYLHGYEFEPEGPLEDVSTAFSASLFWASGGVVSTPNDLNVFMRAYAGGRLLSKETREQQTKWINGSSVNPGPGRNQAGLALFKYTTRCGVVYGHTGTIPGYTQLAAATPDGKRSLTFTLNTQVSPQTPELLARMREVQEDFVCELLRH